uniref:Uncharacterized protein n=1 Tax=Arundo donax TaxID=35708 RepID=A0A0A9DEU0_ARUDO
MLPSTLHALPHPSRGRPLRPFSAPQPITGAPPAPRHCAPLPSTWSTTFVSSAPHPRPPPPHHTAAPSLLRHGRGRPVPPLPVLRSLPASSPSVLPVPPQFFPTSASPLIVFHGFTPSACPHRTYSPKS